jgi:hypothetical protein
VISCETVARPRATNADIEALVIERGHRTLVITRKGGKGVTIPLAPLSVRAIVLATDERPEGPIFRTLPSGGPTCRWVNRPPHGPPRRDHKSRSGRHPQACVINAALHAAPRRQVPGSRDDQER